MSLTHPQTSRQAGPTPAAPGPELAGLVDELDRTVRELVRREGVDPQRDAAVVRRIAESVVRERDEASLTGRVAPVVDAGALVGELVARVSVFGPLQAFLDDPSVEEVWINDPSLVRYGLPGLHDHPRERAPVGRGVYRSGEIGWVGRRVRVRVAPARRWRAGRGPTDGS